MLKEAILAFTLFSLVMSAPTSKPEPVESTAVAKTDPPADGPQKGPQEPANTTTNPETPKTSASKTNQVTSAPPQTTTKQEVPKNEPKTVAPEKKQVTKAPAETTQDEQDLMKWIQKMISDEKEIEHIVNDCDEEEVPMQIQNENDIDYVPYNSDYDSPDDFYGSETEDDYNKDCISCY
ncbi:uncharacterized protein LOC107650100 [Monodelphis domestica]|uniref:uncharacterized protein LOC107650100 n=1 Tax=Monodelphis domestica TaxID=13616 RepID=UPI0024E24A05|nr:uncharacterized protein LOC107650100 [Monodelphis domestica]